MLRKIDLVLRFIYVALVPAILGLFAQFMSVMGLVITTGLATGIALAGTERWRQRVGHIPIVGKFFANFARLGEYYATTQPRLLIYYILYPILFPYWLLARSARREFLLYRRISSIVLLVGIVAGLANYYEKWAPDIKFNQFFGATVGLLFLQLLLTFAVIMPIVTTVIVYHQRAMKKTMVAVLALGVLTGVPTWIFFHRFPIVGFEAQMRVKERTRASPTRAKAAMTAALEAAVGSFIKSSDAELALELARDKLTELYRRDESHGFYLVRVDRTFAIFAKFQRTKAPVAWLAVTIVAPAKPGLHSTLQFVDDPAQLPAVLREILTL